MKHSVYPSWLRPSALSFYALHLDDLLINFNVRNLKMSKGYSSEKTFPLNWSRRCEQVMLAFIGMMLDDIIDEGVEFTYKGEGGASAHDFSLAVYQIDDGRYRTYLKNGHMINDFDPILTGFKAYQVMLKWTDWRGYARVTQAHVDAGRRARIAAKANAGMIRTTRQVTVDDYKDRICAMFPQFQRRGLCLLLNHTVKMLTGAVKHHCHVLVRSSGTDKYPSLVFRLGRLTVSESVMMVRIINAMEFKVRYLYRHLFCIWDRISYFPIGEDFYEAHKEDIEAGKMVDYGEVKLTRVYDSSVGIAFDEKLKYIMKLEGEDFDIGIRFIKPAHLVTDKAVLYDTIEKFTPYEMSISKRKYQLLGNTNMNSRMKVREANLEKMKYWKRKTKYRNNIVKNRTYFTNHEYVGQEREEWERKRMEDKAKVREWFRRRREARRKYKERKMEENKLAIWQRTEA